MSLERREGKDGSSLGVSCGEACVEERDDI
jgi:hypothetical protein